MSRTIKVATLQMDANPAPVTERLNRADKLISRATQEGAKLIVLPELFNTGYTYANTSFDLAEPVDGETSSWMEATASRFNIHLAGSFLVFEKGEIYNSLMLFNPPGQRFRYDKNYPWAWERGYFRGRRGVTVAHTELGDFGMMLCWDVAHRDLWRQYAGRVDMILAASCPPDVPNATYQFPDGSHVHFSDLGPAMDVLKDSGKQVFGEMVDQQARWLGVPVVNSGGSGSIRTHIPRAKTLVSSFLLFAPRLLKQWSGADQMRMASDIVPSCRVVDADGQVIAQRDPHEGEGYTMAVVRLQEQKPKPNGLQPKPPVNWLAYLIADFMVPWMMRTVYKNGLKKIEK